MRIVLASASPRRRELLASVGLEFVVQPSHVPEFRSAGESTATYVVRLAEDKAREVAGREPSAWVIGADTVVEIDGELLEKPSDAAHAATMLRRLSGREHTVFTGVSLLHADGSWCETTLTESRVRMAALGDDDIAWYVATGEPMDKAGSYAVQGIGAWFIESIRGSYTNVVGLPMGTLFSMMRRAGIDPLRPATTRSVRN